MRLNVRALASATALLWGGAVLLVGVGNLLVPTYGVAFLEWAASFYPGYDGPAGLGAVVVSTLYAAVDGAVVGLLLAWLYNVFAGGEEEAGAGG